MCDAPSVGREHAPPRCVFPKDDAYRKNLIRVPSCKPHNTDSSILITRSCGDRRRPSPRRFHRDQSRQGEKRPPSDRQDPAEPQGLAHSVRARERPGGARFLSAASRVRARSAAGIKEWPHNALRHGFASYHLARFNNAAEPALEMGHTNANLIFSVYRPIVQPAEGARFWEIRPEGALHRRNGGGLTPMRIVRRPR